MIEVAVNSVLVSAIAGSTLTVEDCRSENGDSPGPIIKSPRRGNTYRLAASLAARFGADTVVDVGCGCVASFLALDGFQKVGIAFGNRIEQLRESSSNVTWITSDFESLVDLTLEQDTLARSVVICADVIHRLDDPSALLRELACISCRSHAVIITVPMGLVSGRCTHNEVGLSSERDQVAEWHLREFEQLLASHGLVPTFLGLMAGNPASRTKDTMVAVVDNCAQEDAWTLTDRFRPLAIMGTYNDADIAHQTVQKFLDDGFDVRVLDNWSTDGTFEDLTFLAALQGGLTIERFPKDGPTQYHEWAAMLQRKEEIATGYPGRWIIHTDSDEVRCGPWAGISLRGSLHVVERMGFTAVDFTVCDFRPVHDHFRAGMDPEAHLRHFEMGSRGDLFLQIKAWRQGENRVDLASSGGHQANFPSRKVFPYKFILKHYPFRTPAQARRKVFKERKGRFSPVLRARGWHIQYDGCAEDDQFLWNPPQLIEFDERRTRSRYLTELIAGIGIAS